MGGYVKENWKFDASKYSDKIIKFLLPYVSVRGNLSEALRKSGIDLALLTKMSKGGVPVTPHYIYKLLRRGLMKVNDFITVEEIKNMEDKDEQSFWLKMIIEQDKEFSYWLNQAILLDKGGEAMDAIKRIVMGT